MHMINRVSHFCVRNCQISWSVIINHLHYIAPNVERVIVFVILKSLEIEGNLLLIKSGLPERGISVIPEACVGIFFAPWQKIQHHIILAWFNNLNWCGVLGTWMSHVQVEFNSLLFCQCMRKKCIYLVTYLALFVPNSFSLPLLLWLAVENWESIILIHLSIILNLLNCCLGVSQSLSFLAFVGGCTKTF